MIIDSYKFILEIQTGILYNMTISNSEGQILASAAPGRSWDADALPWDVAFAMHRPTSVVTFSALARDGNVHGSWSVEAVE